MVAIEIIVSQLHIIGDMNRLGRGGRRGREEGAASLGGGATEGEQESPSRVEARGGNGLGGN